MKLITLLVSALMLLISTVATQQYEQASRLSPRLAPHLASTKESSKTLITRNDNREKNFTHNELFTLQRKFLDNFIAPNNTIQVSSPAMDLGFLTWIRQY